ncbi:unnamed protein product [Cochlearia groenlandica]
MKLQGLLCVAIFCLAAYTNLATAQSLQPRRCKTSCGNVAIEFPFGTSQGCYYEEDASFKITCNEKNELIFGGSNVTNISHSGELRVLAKRSFNCYNDRGTLADGIYYNYTLGNLTLSKKNMFIAVGCDTYAYLNTAGDVSDTTGCISRCRSPPPDMNGTCSGGGCCKTSVAGGSKGFSVRAFSFDNHTSVHSFSPCSYAFLVEDGMFNFSSREDLSNLRQVTSFPLVLDWSIGNKTCGQVGTNMTLCRGNNSECYDSDTRKGYICKCKTGYEGNPYLFEEEYGCKDINECATSEHNNCSSSSICEDKPGGFDCTCKSGFDLNKTDNSCFPKPKPIYYVWTIISLGAAIGFLLLLLTISFIQQRIKHRKNTELRRQFFEQNGGGMLIQRLSGAGPSNVDVKIYTEEGMKEATDGYDESRILGQGGQGTVYKGIFPDNSVVAIKKARLGDRSQVEQFINEVLVLSQINHRNVVKLMGCCLETEVPLLVYEFITSGTLFDHLHGSLVDSSLTWEHRLRIAIEVAGTLAYLHSSASIPIIHRDVKTANILLDENLTAKVADFGASRLIPMDKEDLTTMVQGTLGYLDPEYYNTGLLNEKSDVYSFGVVLMELLSGQKALCFQRTQQSKHLVSYIASAMKENRLEEVIQGYAVNEDNQKEIKEAARIAVECTRVTGEERPRMKQVAAKLEGLTTTTTTNKHKWTDHQYEPEEVNHLLGVEILPANGETSSTTGYDSIKNVARLDIEAGR